MNNWLLVLLLLCQTVTWSVCTRCLTNRTDLHRKNFFYYGNSTKNLTIESSNRITHNISSNIFRIFLEEVLGYNAVDILIFDDEYSGLSALDRIALLDDEFRDTPVDPVVMINLEVLADSSFTVKTAGRQEVHEAGLIAPFGRFGWYVSREKNVQLESFRQSKPIYSLSEDEKKIAKQFSLIDVDDVGCGNKLCDNSYYKPMMCYLETCATLLADDFNSTKVVMDHIKEMGLLVEVMWLGPHLTHFLDKLKKKDVLVMTWSPGPVTISRQWQPVIMRPCWNNATAPECFYEPRRLVKLVSKQVRNGASTAYHSLIYTSFLRNEYEDLVRLAMENPSKDHYEIACDWMQANDSIWRGWIDDVTQKPELTICGIFPIKGSLAWVTLPDAALMAVKAVNNNTNVLNQYDLKLSNHNGECNSDKVTNIFIDYILAFNSNRMVGILGPACSDTVEPLVGITKYFRTVVISYSAEGALFSDKEKQPFFFRTIGENQQFKQVYLKLLKRMGWKRMAALTEDGQKYTEYLSHLQDLLQANNMTFITHRKFPRINATMRSYLVDLQERRARIIVADVYDIAARSVMCEAYRLNMTAAEGYVWFLPQWLSPDWFDMNKIRDDKVNCTTEEMRRAIEGHFSLAHVYFAADDVVTHENITVGKWKTDILKNNKSGSVSNYAGYAYDAVWMYAYALDKLHKADAAYLSNIHSPESSKKFMEFLQATDFMGVSGRIRFRGGSSRITNVNILQWINGTFNNVGVAEYNPSDASDKIEYNLTLYESKIKWLTKDRLKPSDGEELPTCMLQGLVDLLNVNCNGAIVIANVIGFACLAVVLVGVVAITKRRYDKRVEELEKADRYFKSIGIDLLPSVSDLDKWEIPRDLVVINRRLGEGAFGTVYGGEAFMEGDGWVAAAVKTLKTNSTTEVKLDFLSEAEVMKRFDHKNIVKLLGVCTRDDPVYTVMEFMLYGDLKTFLLNRRHLVSGRRMPDEGNDDISNKKLTGMALDIARGLSYLASLKYVHRDIACRNCLLNSARVAKIGDFGLTRKMYESDYYRFTRKGMMPIRWMAPECLADGVFTTKSDVWSFGVVLYEIVTFGSYPYQGLSNNQVMEHVKAGNTIDIPKSVKPQLEALMKSCWITDYGQRPDITEIVVYLANNPRLLSPCLDGPSSSVAVEDSEIFQGRPSVPASPFEQPINLFQGDSLLNLGDRTTPPASPTELAPTSGFFTDNVREQLLPNNNQPVHIAMQRLAPLASRTPSDIDLQNGP